MNNTLNIEDEIYEAIIGFCRTLEKKGDLTIDSEFVAKSIARLSSRRVKQQVGVGSLHTGVQPSGVREIEL